MSSQSINLREQDMMLLNSKKGYRFILNQKNPDISEVLLRLHFEKRKKELQIEMIKMQAWIVKRRKRLIIVFEGREMAGKGSAILQFAQHLNPRNMKMVALPKPTIMQKRQWYFRRYIREFPKPGEIVFFDRSWYNRAMVEPVNGFCSKSKYNKFMNDVNPFEEMIMNDGIHLIKFYFSISKKEQKRRLDLVRNNPLKKWRLSEVDENALNLWDKYTEYKEKMLEVTNRNNSPWVIIDANNPYKARIEAMEYVLSQVMYV